MTDKKKRYTTTAISFSGQEDLLETVRAKARADNRSVSNFICTVLADYFSKMESSEVMQLRDSPISSSNPGHIFDTSQKDTQSALPAAATTTKRQHPKESGDAPPLKSYLRESRKKK